MFCENCGNQLEDDAIFCPECGQVIKEEVTAVKVEKLQEQKVTAESENVEKLDGNHVKSEEKKRGVSGKVLIVAVIIIIVLACFKSDENGIKKVAKQNYMNTTANNIINSNALDSNESGNVSSPKKVQPNLNEYDDDLVIKFECEEFERCVRRVIGKEDGEITYKDVKEIKYWWGNTRIKNSKELKYFSSLETLELNTEEEDLSHICDLKTLDTLHIYIDNEEINLNTIVEMSNLFTLAISSNTGRNVDLTPLAGMSSLKCLSLDNVVLEDSSFLKTMYQLEFLYIHNVNVDYDVVADLSNLREITIEYEDNSVDISAIGKSPSIELVRVSSGEAYDYSFLGNMKQLESLYLYPIRTSLGLDSLENLVTFNAEIIGNEFNSQFLANNKKLMYASIRGNCELQPLSKLEIYNLDIECNELLTDLSIFKESKIHDLSIMECHNLHDISCVEEIQKLSKFEMHFCDGVEQEEIDAMKEIVEKKAQERRTQLSN